MLNFFIIENNYQLVCFGWMLKSLFCCFAHRHIHRSQTYLAFMSESFVLYRNLAMPTQITDDSDSFAACRSKYTKTVHYIKCHGKSNICCTDLFSMDGPDSSGPSLKSQCKTCPKSVCCNRTSAPQQSWGQIQFPIWGWWLHCIESIMLKVSEQMNTQGKRESQLRYLRSK